MLKELVEGIVITTAAGLFACCIVAAAMLWTKHPETFHSLLVVGGLVFPVLWAVVLIVTVGMHFLHKRKT
jgi:hypothetical protein